MAELPVPDGVDPTDPAYVENPVTGERFRFHDPPDVPATDPLAFDLWAPPGMTPLGAHVHPEQDEVFTVREDAVELSRRGEVGQVDAGETVTVPAGTPHTWWPAGETELHLAVRFEPGLASEAFLRDLAALARAGRVGDDGVPGPLQVAALYDAYGYGVMHLASPPLVVQKTLFATLAPVARWRGYTANPVAERDD